MTIKDNITDEKQQYNINRESAKIAALLPRKIGKYGYLTGEEIVTLDQSRMTEQAKFTYSPLGKALERQTKVIEDQGRQILPQIKKKDQQL